MWAFCFLLSNLKWAHIFDAGLSHIYMWAVWLLVFYHCGHLLCACVFHVMMRLVNNECNEVKFWIIWRQIQACVNVVNSLQLWNTEKKSFFICVPRCHMFLMTRLCLNMRKVYSSRKQNSLHSYIVWCNIDTFEISPRVLTLIEWKHLVSPI